MRLRSRTVPVMMHPTLLVQAQCVRWDRALPLSRVPTSATMQGQVQMQTRDRVAVLRRWKAFIERLINFTVTAARFVVQVMSMLAKSPHVTSHVRPGVLVKNLTDLQRGRYLSAKQREAYQVRPDECQHGRGFRKYGAQYKDTGHQTLRIRDLCGCRYLRVSGKMERPEQWRLISPRPAPSSSKKAAE